MLYSGGDMVGGILVAFVLGLAVMWSHGETQRMERQFSATDSACAAGVMDRIDSSYRAARDR